VTRPPSKLISGQVGSTPEARRMGCVLRAGFTVPRYPTVRCSRNLRNRNGHEKFANLLRDIRHSFSFTRRAKPFGYHLNGSAELWIRRYAFVVLNRQQKISGTLALNVVAHLLKILERGTGALDDWTLILFPTKLG